MRRTLLQIGTAYLLLCATSAAFAQGIVLPGVGPVNRSMGGAGVALPLDATGAIHWNPASISFLPESRVDLAGDFLWADNRVSSGLFVGTPGEISGTTKSDSGTAILPAVSAVYKPDDGPLTFGLGMNAIGGFFVNYPGSLANPILTPPAPVGAGFGPVYSKLTLLQIAPTASVEVTEGFSIGLAPTFTSADVSVNPFPFAPPDDANGDGFFTFPSGTNLHSTWGIGVQGGIFYQSEMGLNLGFSVKSPVWFQRFHGNASDELGLSRMVAADLEYPMIISGGIGYQLFEDTLLAADVRWIDYASTDTFGDPAGFSPFGSVTGLGWRSVWSTAFGVQQRLTDWMVVRIGYSYNQNPVRNRLATFSLQAPAVYQHVLNVGTSVDLTENLIFSATYVHGFENEVSGPIIAPGGPVPLSVISNRQELNALVLGVSFLF